MREAARHSIRRRQSSASGNRPSSTERLRQFEGVSPLSSLIVHSAAPLTVHLSPQAHHGVGSPDAQASPPGRFALLAGEGGRATTLPIGGMQSREEVPVPPRSGSRGRRCRCSYDQPPGGAAAASGNRRVHHVVYRSRQPRPASRVARRMRPHPRALQPALAAAQSRGPRFLAHREHSLRAPPGPVAGEGSRLRIAASLLSCLASRRTRLRGLAHGKDARLAVEPTKEPAP